MRESKYGKIKVFFEEEQRAAFVDNVHIEASFDFFYLNFLQRTPSVVPLNEREEIEVDCIARVAMTTTQISKLYEDLGNLLQQIGREEEKQEGEAS